MFFYGCIPDKCGSVQCMNEGVCVQGYCTCPYGFEGDFCEHKWHDKFNVNWTATEKLKTEIIRNYTLRVLPATGPDTFYILGLAEIVDTVVCTRKSSNIFTINERILPDTSKIQGGEGVFDPATGIVTGLYSFNKQDVITTISFTWTN